LPINIDTTFLTKSVENRGNEGVTFDPSNRVITAVPTAGKMHDLASEAAISAIKEEVVKECKRMIREARRQVEIKNVRDYKTVVELALDMLGAGKEGSSKSGPLIQVQILGDSGKREPVLVRSIESKPESIMGSGNESEVIEAESVLV
jgi:hypothetical protein